MPADIKTTIAHEAVRIVTGARRSAYGRPEQNFERIGFFWQAWLDAQGFIIARKDQLTDYNRNNFEANEVRVDATWVPPFMRLMKEARLAETPDHLDSYVDLVGYALCGAEVAGVDGSALGKAGPEADGWVEWSGGWVMPVAVGTLIDVRHRDGDVFEGTPAGGAHSRDWRHLNGGGDIVAYRVVEPKQPAKLQIEAGKYYRTRGGDRVIGPMYRIKPLCGQSWRGIDSLDGDEVEYYDNGRFFVNAEAGASKMDLIEEVAAP